MLLKVRGLTVHYGNVLALNNITMDVKEGQIISIIGANGAGKTTLLRTISGLEQATSGEIWFNGDRVDSFRPEEMVLRGVGHVPQGRRLFPYMTVSENLRLGAYARKIRKDEIEDDLDSVFVYFPRLKERSHQKAGTLSGGEQQMVAIGRGLMAKPKLFLLDEPSLGLAPIITREIGNIIKVINQDGMSVILVEQNAALALGIAHRGYLLEIGQIILEGTTAELLGNEKIKEAYLGG